MSKRSILVLFDVDGTLTVARQRVKPAMSELLQRLKTKACIGLVSGSDLGKVSEQMGENCLKEFDFVFPENGLVSYQNGELLKCENIDIFMANKFKDQGEQKGEEKLQEFVQFCSEYMSKLDIPMRTSNFIEKRNGLINLCPPGRAVTQSERDTFGRFDQENGIRKQFVQALNDRYPDLGLRFAIGGQISIDAYPHGWDKTFCLRYVEKDFKEIHFFGDRTDEGGNDYDIYNDPRVQGHKVLSPEDTMKQLKEKFDL